MKKLTALLGMLAVLTALLLSGCSPDEPVYSQIIDSNGEIITIDSTTGAIATQVVDSNGNIIIIEDRALVFMDWEHYKIHEGDTYTIIQTTDLGNGGVRDILVVPPNTAVRAHLIWEIEHELETSIQFYRGTTYTDNGTAIVSFNRNGNSLNTATTLVYHTPTITNAGTLIGTIQQGDGKKAGGSDRESNEFILKQGTAYLIRITNLTVNNNLIFLKLNWYELVED